MKALALLLTIFVFAPTTPKKTTDYSWVIEEMENNTSVFDIEQIAPAEIIIYDIIADQLVEIKQMDYIMGNLPVHDMEAINDSDFLFEYLGDSYYLKS